MVRARHRIQDGRGLVGQEELVAWNFSCPLYRKLGVPPPQPDPVHQHADVWSYDRYVPAEASDGAEEVAEEDYDAVELDAEAYQGPAQEDESQTAEECRGALCLLFPREEEERFLRSDYDGEADEEENLEHYVSRGRWHDRDPVPGRGGSYIPHGKPAESRTR